jgi:amino acid permease
VTPIVSPVRAPIKTVPLALKNIFFFIKTVFHVVGLLTIALNAQMTDLVPNVKAELSLMAKPVLLAY